MDEFKIYKIDCITNMHVGSGDSSYSLIDNQVQRDVITNFPTINASSLKGSLKEFLNYKYIDGNKNNINRIFGTEDARGEYKIFPAMLLAIPVRSNKATFFRATCPRIIKDLNNFISSFGYNKILKLDELVKNIDDKKNSSIIITSNENNKNSYGKLKIEGYEIELENRNIEDKEYKRYEKIFGQDFIILDDNNFSEIISELPIIARNRLENGESENLWYEEIVPRETKFYFGVIESEKEDLETTFKEIESEPVQIGGNATIGRGYCSISEFI